MTNNTDRNMVILRTVFAEEYFGELIEENEKTIKIRRPLRVSTGSQRSLLLMDRVTLVDSYDNDYQIDTKWILTRAKPSKNMINQYFNNIDKYYPDEDEVAQVLDVFGGPDKILDSMLNKGPRPPEEVRAKMLKAAQDKLKELKDGKETDE